MEGASRLRLPGIWLCSIWLILLLTDFGRNLGGLAQDIGVNCDEDDANCVCGELGNSTTCFCDWGFVLDPQYTPPIGKMKTCTKNCQPGWPHCWTSPTSHTVCPVGESECFCAFGYTAVLRSNSRVDCEPVNCHKKYLLNDNEICLCGPHNAFSTETNCECADGFVGNKTAHPGFCKGFQCTPGEGSGCFCPDGPDSPTTCQCQSGLTNKYSFLVETTDTGGGNRRRERRCIEGTECPAGTSLNSFSSNLTDCTLHRCIKGTPFCDTSSVYRVCEDGYTPNWDLTCVPVQCNNKILNTDVSYCTCPSRDDGTVIETDCRCFVNYVPDYDKPGQCRTLCDVDMRFCKSENMEACTEMNNENCVCEQGYMAALLDTSSVGEVMNVDRSGRYLLPGLGYVAEGVSGAAYGCVPVCREVGDPNCQADTSGGGSGAVKCRDGFTPNNEQVCVSYECNAGFEPETYHCDCDQDAFGSVAQVAGFIIDTPSKFPLTCFCLPGYVSNFMEGKRYCKEQSCDPLSDFFCGAETSTEGDVLFETAQCQQGYLPYRDFSHDTDDEGDQFDAWKADHLPTCVAVEPEPASDNSTASAGAVAGCQPGDDGCVVAGTSMPCSDGALSGGASCECDFANGYTVIDGRCYQLTCDPSVVDAQYPGDTGVYPSGFLSSDRICVNQFNPDTNQFAFYCTTGFHPNGTGGCDIDCNNYFPGCTKYADNSFFRCGWGYTPHIILTDDGFGQDHTCLEVECNALKDHCVCPNYPGQTFVKIEKDCECEMGYASDGNGGCMDLCLRAETANCNTDCVGPTCRCDPGFSLTHDRETDTYTCREINCHNGTENCDCGFDPQHPDASMYLEEWDCECVNGTLPLKDGTCTLPVLTSCVTCSSNDPLNACVQHVNIDGIRGITTKACDKHSGYFGCWVKEQVYGNGSYLFERGCGYYCTDSFLNSTYCYNNQPGTSEQNTICQRCCKEGEDCNIMELGSGMTAGAGVALPCLIALLTPFLLLLR